MHMYIYIYTYMCVDRYGWILCGVACLQILSVSRPFKKQSHDDSFEAPKLVDFLKENGEVRFRRDPYPLVMSK